MEVIRQEIQCRAKSQRKIVKACESCWMKQCRSTEREGTARGNTPSDAVLAPRQGVEKSRLAHNVRWSALKKQIWKRNNSRRQYTNRCIVLKHLNWFLFHMTPVLRSVDRVEFDNRNQFKNNWKIHLSHHHNNTLKQGRTGHLWILENHRTAGTPLSTHAFNTCFFPH